MSLKIGTRVILIGDKRLTKGIFGKISGYIYFRKRAIKILKKNLKQTLSYGLELLISIFIIGKVKW